METIHDFMGEKAIPEHFVLIKELDVLFESQGYVTHEESLAEIGYDIGVIDDVIVVDKILNTYKQHLNKLLLKMFVVTYEDATVYQLKDILETLIQLEKTIESETIVSSHREENGPITQLIEWVTIIDESKVTLFEDLVLEVSESLIENIFELHELRVPLEPIEIDPKIPIRISFIKKMVSSIEDKTTYPLLVLDYIKKYGFKDFADKETLSAVFGSQLRANPVTSMNLRRIATDILAICLLLDCKGDFSSRCREFIELNFANPLTQSDLQSEIGKLIAEYEIKC